MLPQEYNRNVTAVKTHNNPRPKSAAKLGLEIGGRDCYTCAMSGEDEDEEVKRHRRTVYLLAAGAVSLLLPLAGVAYIRITNNTTSETANPGASVFSRRGGADAKSYIKAVEMPMAAPPTYTAVPATTAGASLAGAGPAAAPNPAGASAMSSLGMVKGSDDYYQDPKPAAAPQAPAAAPAAAPKVAANAAAADEEEPAPKKGRKTAKKPMPSMRLQSTSASFTPAAFSNKMGGGKPGANAQPGGPQGGPPGAGGPPPDMAAMMKNMPGGGAGMPDMGALMKAAQGGQGGQPDMNALMQQSKQQSGGQR